MLYIKLGTISREESMTTESSTIPLYSSKMTLSSFTRILFDVNNPTNRE